MATHDPAADPLRRHIGLASAVFLVVGNVIGSGIFLTPGLIARDLPSSGGIVMAWVIGGVISLLGALTYAELGAMLPRSGGLYAYLRAAYGARIAFLFGWASLTVILTGQIAGISLGFVEYLSYFWPAASTSSANAVSVMALPWGGVVTLGQLCGVALIAMLCAVNIFALQGGKFVAVTLTMAKVALLLLLPLLAFGSGHAIPPLTFGTTGDAGLFGALGLVLIPILFTYEGWANLSFAAGEIKDPARNVPRGLIIGISVVTLIYVLVNLTYLAALPIERMAGTLRAGDAAATALGGSAGASGFVALALLSTGGTIAAFIFVSARVFYAMARDGLFFAAVGHVHPRWGTPAVAVAVTGFWSIVLAQSGSYEQLYTFVLFGVLVFSMLTAAAVIVLRRRDPDAVRPYRVPGYPYVPLLFIAVMAMLAINTLVEKPFAAAIGTALIAAGLPIYELFRRRRAKDDVSG